jgi:hypothetical protein
MMYDPTSDKYMPVASEDAPSQSHSLCLMTRGFHV